MLRPRAELSWLRKGLDDYQGPGIRDPDSADWRLTSGVWDKTQVGLVLCHRKPHSQATRTCPESREQQGQGGPQDLALPTIPCHSPGMGPGLEASIVTRTEASRVPELPVTWHEYSPESGGDTWFSLSRGPWTCRVESV